VSDSRAGERGIDDGERMPTAHVPAAPEGPAPAAPPTPEAVVEPPSPDVTLASEASPLPGVHRGGFLRLPTAPVAITTQIAPAEPGTADDPAPVLEWYVPEPEAPHRGLAAWALVFAIMGLVVAFFVGWGFPIGLVAIVSAILALRRPLESRGVAVWALCLGTLSVLYSAGWLLFAAGQASLFG
jgi:hypothetical protein